MKNNQIIAIWGSPSAGKTTTSIKLARELSLKKKNIILVMCDTLCPELMSVLPKTDTSNKSIGSLLALPEITQEHILSKCITLDKNQYITLLGYAQGENIFTYAQYSKERAIDFLILLRHLADYVIVDCSSGFTGDVLSTVALEMADMVLRLGKANLKSVSYFNSYLPVLADRRFNTDKHIKVLSNVKVIEPREQVKELFGGARYELPHTEELEVQFLNGELFSGLTGKSSFEYIKSLETLTKRILGEEINANKEKAKSIKDKDSKKLMRNGILSSIKLWKGGKERE